MKFPQYDVPDEAPQHVKNWLKHTKSRKKLSLIVVLSLLAALATAYAERGKLSALLGLVFLLTAVGPFLAIRWGDRHNYFDKN
jgi:hypothetical protein